MPYQTVALATAFIGSSIAAIWDLKTTEIPNQIPYIMIAVALVAYGVQSYVESNYWILGSSIISGLALLGFGFLMYYLGQWGGGDAQLMGAVGFLLPAAPSGFVPLTFLFPLSFTFNLFFVGAVYMIVYAMGMAVMNRGIIYRFLGDVKASANVLFLGSIGLFFVFLILNYYIATIFSISSNAAFLIVNSIFPLVATVLVFLLWRFAVAVETVGFKKKISVGKLKVGDVPAYFKLWEGITEDELRKVKRSGKRFIWIKDGVRFAPSFPLALLFTLYVGDGILLFFNFVI